MRGFTTVIYLTILFIGPITKNAIGSRNPRPPSPPVSYQGRDRTPLPRTTRPPGIPSCCMNAFHGFRPPPSFNHAPVSSLRKRARNQRDRTSLGNSARVPSKNVHTRPEVSSGRDQDRPKSTDTAQTLRNAQRNAGSVLRVRTRTLPPISAYYVLHRDQANNDNGLRRRLPPYYVPSDHSSPSTGGSALVPPTNIQTSPDIFSVEQTRSSGNMVQRPSSAPISPASSPVRTGPPPAVSGYYFLHRDQANSDNGLRRRLPPYYVSSDNPVEASKTPTVVKVHSPQIQSDGMPPTGTKPVLPTDIERLPSQKSSGGRVSNQEVPIPRASQNLSTDAGNERHPFVDSGSSPEPRNVVHRQVAQAFEDSKPPQSSDVLPNPETESSHPSSDANKMTHDVARTRFEMNSPEAFKEMNNLIRTRPKDAQNILSRVNARDLANLISEGTKRQRDNVKIINAGGMPRT